MTIILRLHKVWIVNPSSVTGVVGYKECKYRMELYSLMIVTCLSLVDNCESQDVMTSQDMCTHTQEYVYTHTHTHTAQMFTSPLFCELYE